MGIQTDNLLKRVTNIFKKSAQSVFYQIMNGAGEALDQVDPAQIKLSNEFSVTTATGSALDKHGDDWGVPRRLNEDDDSYRKRILAQLPTFASGPSVTNIKAVVRPFTGFDPDIFEYGPDSFTMGVSVMGSFGFLMSGDTFTFQVTVNNPNGALYNTQDLEDAVTEAMPARSTVLFIHNLLIDGGGYSDQTSQIIDGGSFLDNVWYQNSVDGGGW